MKIFRAVVENKSHFSDLFCVLILDLKELESKHPWLCWVDSTVSPLKAGEGQGTSYN